MNLRASFQCFLTAACLAAAPAAADDDASASGPPEEPVVPLSPLIVQAKPLTCFGLSLQMVAMRNTRQILRMFVREVVPYSEADANGLAPGMEILRVDGRDVQTFVVRFDPASDLGRVFVNRKRGARVRLEVLTPGSARSRTVVLIQGQPRPFDPFEREEWP